MLWPTTKLRCLARSLPYIFLVLSCACVSTGILTRKRVKMGLQNKVTRSHVNWSYVAKFGFDTGKSSYANRIKVVYPASNPPAVKFDLEAYMDDEWPLALETADPCERKKLARKTRKIAYNNNGRDFGPWINGTISQHLRPHVWFFVLSACNASLQNKTVTVLLEFRGTQDSGSHFSVEQRWAPQANLLVLLCSTAFLLVFWRRAAAFAASLGEIHPVIWTLGSAALILYGAQLLHTGHLAVFRSNGSGIQAMEVLSEVLFMISQVVQSTLLILIAMGYTLLRSKIGSLEFVIPIFGIVAMVHILLVVFDKAQQDDLHKFTQHEGFKGWLIIMVRVGLYIWFLVASRDTAREGGLRIQTFMRRFRLAATLYFLAYPALFFLVRVIAAYWRRPIMEAGLMGSQIASNVWLATLFLTKGEYFEASSLGSSPLPGASPTWFKHD